MEIGLESIPPQYPSTGYICGRKSSPQSGRTIGKVTKTWFGRMDEGSTVVWINHQGQRALGGAGPMSPYYNQVIATLTLI
jgi:hypothetical protein